MNEREESSDLYPEVGTRQVSRPPSCAAFNTISTSGVDLIPPPKCKFIENFSGRTYSKFNIVGSFGCLGPSNTPQQVGARPKSPNQLPNICESTRPYQEAIIT